MRCMKCGSRNVIETIARCLRCSEMTGRLTYVGVTPRLSYSKVSSFWRTVAAIEAANRLAAQIGAAQITKDEAQKVLADIFRDAGA